MQITKYHNVLLIILFKSISCDNSGDLVNVKYSIGVFEILLFALVKKVAIVSNQWSHQFGLETIGMSY